jgi:NitT/TauT family transport system substrate-binding protein
MAQGRRVWPLLCAALISIATLLISCSSPTPSPVASQPTSAPTAAASPASPSPTAKPAPDKVTLRLSWRWKAEFAPLVLADDKGFFKEENIEVQLLEGKGSGDVVPLIANKTDTFGYLNLTTVAISIAKGLPVKVVAGLMAKNPSALAFFAEKNIKQPKDLEGKSIALTPGEAFAVIWPAFASKWNIDTSKVTTVNLDPAVKNQAFLEGRIDVLPVYVNNELPQLRYQAKKPIDILTPADWGFNTIANGIITHVDTIKEKPDLVRRFVRAVAKGYKYAIDHPDEAVAAVSKRSDALASQPKEVLLEQVKMTLDFMYSPNNKGKPIGWMAEQDWNATIDQLFETKAIEKRLPNDTFYTNEFVPQQ